MLPSLCTTGYFICCFVHWQPARWRVCGGYVSQIERGKKRVPPSSNRRWLSVEGGWRCETETSGPGVADGVCVDAGVWVGCAPCACVRFPGFALERGGGGWTADCVAMARGDAAVALRSRDREKANHGRLEGGQALRLGGELACLVMVVRDGKVWTFLSADELFSVCFFCFFFFWTILQGRSVRPVLKQVCTCKIPSLVTTSALIEMSYDRAHVLACSLSPSISGRLQGRCGYRTGLSMLKALVVWIKLISGCVCYTARESSCCGKATTLQNLQFAPSAE